MSITGPLRCAIVTAAVLLAGARSALAQEEAVRLVEAARVQLEAPNPDSAAALLERALDPRQSATPAVQVRAWVLYAIAQMMRDNRSMARQALRQALQRDAALRIDSLYFFHEELEREFAAERVAFAPAPEAPAPAPETPKPAERPRVPLTLSVRVPTDTTVEPPDGALPIEVRPSRWVRVLVAVGPADRPAAVRWSDSLLLGETGWAVWNLRGPDDSIIAPGRYVLRVTAADSQGQETAPFATVIEVSRPPVDTAPHPRPLEPADFVPETVQAGLGPLHGLAVGLALGAATAALPTALGSAELNGGLQVDATAYVVAGTLAVSAVGGFLAGHHPRPVPENVQRNREVRERDVLERRAVAQQNASARANGPIRVRLEGVGP